ncbi:MAG TPA: permease-like cell division protein FtsX [Ignavibacteriaceae bacterium]|nr:permease-like cell division protein FtsX [Ignavibacteriaceae bacterium]
MILFFIKESLRLFSRAKLSSFLTFVSTSIAVVLIVISYFLYQSSENLENYLKENISISVFLKDSVQKNKFENIQEEILNTGFISNAEFISKEKAVEIFIKETGEDFRKILDYNPLPSSFNLKLKSDFAEQDSVKKIISTLEAFPWVDEVVYRDDYMQKLLSYIKEFRLYILGITAIILLVSIYLVYSTVRLIINSRTEEFETMKLVGAKLSTIKIPIILNGLMIGLLSAFAAGILFYLIISYAGGYISTIKVIKFDYVQFLIIMSISGPLLSFLVTLISLRKVSLKIST